MLFKNLLSAILVVIIALSSAPSKAQEIDRCYDEKRHVLFTKVSDAHQIFMRVPFPYHENSIDDHTLNTLKERFSDLYLISSKALTVGSFISFAGSTIIAGIGTSFLYLIGTHTKTNFLNIFSSIISGTIMTAVTASCLYLLLLQGMEARERSSELRKRSDELLSL